MKTGRETHFKKGKRVSLLSVLLHQNILWIILLGEGEGGIKIKRSKSIFPYKNDGRACRTL